MAYNKQGCFPLGASMLLLIKIIHVLSLAAWAGATLFFSFLVALPTITSMQQFAERSGNWLHLNTKEQGTRLAGEFLDVVFSRYFPFQCICGVLALATAVWWFSLPGWLSKVRVALVALALCGAAANYFVLAPRVHELRTLRYSTDAAIAEKASADFGPAHTYSLLVDMAGLACVLAALVLVLWLPKE